jgi:hypothetical protein
MNINRYFHANMFSFVTNISIQISKCEQYNAYTYIKIEQQYTNIRSSWNTVKIPTTEEPNNNSNNKSSNNKILAPIFYIIFTIECGEGLL